MQCSHGPCTCQVTYEGDVCSEACRNAMAATDGTQCPCGHALCAGSQGLYQPGGGQAVDPLPPPL